MKKLQHFLSVSYQLLVFLLVSATGCQVTSPSPEAPSLSNVESDAPLDSTPTEVETAATASAPSSQVRIGFYNVENLFDTQDDPISNDDDFLPSGELKWDESRYQTKLKQLGKVIAAMEIPALLGLCEIENAAVLKDLANTPALASARYKVVHHESNDYRGIDVGLLYNTTQFEIIGYQPIVIDIPSSVSGQRDYSTRDILHITLRYKTNGTTLHCLVNHFPSRRAGAGETDDLREFVAKQLAAGVAKIRAQTADAQIIIMGDFNDTPNDNSIRTVLGAVENNTEAKQELVNAMIPLVRKGEGSYNFKGDWQMLDQMIISDNFIDGSGNWKLLQAEVFSRDWMLYGNANYGKTPNRTYGGTKYFGGFSDHLPVFIDIRSR